MNVYPKETQCSCGIMTRDKKGICCICRSGQRAVLRILWRTLGIYQYIK